MADKDKPWVADGYPEDYPEALEREAAGYKNRIAELEALDDPLAAGAIKDAKSGLAAAKAELRRIGAAGQKEAAKRPKRARETR